MPYTHTVAVVLGGGNTGLTLEAQLVDTAGVDVGSAITTGFVEIGGGNYEWTNAAMPTGFRGVVKFNISPGGTLMAIVAINPETVEPSSLIGPGSIAWCITVEDGLAQPISGAEIWVSTDIAGLNVIAGTLTTDDFGQVTFMLDAGSYYVWKDHPGFNFTNPELITVS
jgi:hypothetical protein